VLNKATWGLRDMKFLKESEMKVSVDIKRTNNWLALRVTKGDKFEAKFINLDRVTEVEAKDARMVFHLSDGRKITYQWEGVQPSWETILFGVLMGETPK
jgi:hypothetical protein